MNKVILKANCKFEDTKLREEFFKLITKVETLNERTKNHTIEIRELKNNMKKRK